jgi:hypothetical protein
MPGPSSPQQGLDTLPYTVWQKNVKFFADYLPNWSPNATHNLQLGVTNERLALQTGLPMQNGSHPWINDPVAELFNDPKWMNASDARKTEMLAE